MCTVPFAAENGRDGTWGDLAPTRCARGHDRSVRGCDRKLGGRLPNRRFARNGAGAAGRGGTAAEGGRRDGCPFKGRRYLRPQRIYPVEACLSLAEIGSRRRRGGDGRNREKRPDRSAISGEAHDQETGKADRHADETRATACGESVVVVDYLPRDDRADPGRADPGRARRRARGVPGLHLAGSDGPDRQRPGIRHGRAQSAEGPRERSGRPRTV